MPTERWRTCLSAAVLAALVALTSGCANDLSKRSARPRPVDMGLLQFLGSADPTSDKQRSAGASWMGYLSKLRLGTAVRTTKTTGTTGGRASTSASKSAAEPSTSGVGSR